MCHQIFHRPRFFFLVAASIVPGSDLTLSHVGINPTRIGILEILKLMGADIDVLNAHEVGGEPVADLRVRYALLNGIEESGAKCRCPDADPMAVTGGPR